MISEKEKITNLKEIYGSFKTITSNLKNATISPEFWKKERENIIKNNNLTKEWKNSMKMSFEKYHQEFTI